MSAPPRMAWHHALSNLVNVSRRRDHNLFAQGLTAQGFQLLRDYRVGGLGAKQRAVQADTQKGIKP